MRVRKSIDIVYKRKRALGFGYDNVERGVHVAGMQVWWASSSWERGKSCVGLTHNARFYSA